VKLLALSLCPTLPLTWRKGNPPLGCKKGQLMAENVILRRPQVEQTTGLSRSTLYAMMAEGAFPRPVKLGKRAVGWRASDISAWLESREESAA
jgi:prophage regulatory protein